jgi:hypothetical protein
MGFVKSVFALDNSVWALNSSALVARRERHCLLAGWLASFLTSAFDYMLQNGRATACCGSSFSLVKRKYRRK